MNGNGIEVQWKLLVGRAQEQWGKLTNDDIDIIAASRDQLTGKVQQRYGVALDEAERQVARWERSAIDSRFAANERN